MKYNTGRKNKARYIRLAATAAAVLLVSFITAYGIMQARAESMTVKAWVLCQQADYINVRSTASKKGEAIGWLNCGDEVDLSGKAQNGFAEIVNGIDTAKSAWVYAGYIVFDRPVWSGRQMFVASNARVAARKCVEGEVRRWLQPGDVVTVYWESAEWSVTNRGFVKTEYLEDYWE